MVALAILCAAVQCTKANSIEAPKPLSNVYDIFGNTNTQRVESQIEYLQFQYPRKQEMISGNDADEAYRKLDSLVSQVSDFEQLMRLGYWSKTAHPSPYDSPVAIVEATCGSSLRRIKTLFPKNFQDAVYEMGMLIRADGGSGEMIDQLLTGADKAPKKNTSGCLRWSRWCERCQHSKAAVLAFQSDQVVLVTMEVNLEWEMLICNWYYLRH